MILEDILRERLKNKCDNNLDYYVQLVAELVCIYNTKKSKV